MQSDIYYLWSLERVCVALGLRSLDGFDWYGHGARSCWIVRSDDGGWPRDRWGQAARARASRLLFLRKANLAFEIDRVLRLPSSEQRRPRWCREASRRRGATNQERARSGIRALAAGNAAGEAGTDDVKVVVTGARRAVVSADLGSV